MAGLLGESRTDAVALSTSAGLAAHRVEQRLERAKATGELRADLDVRVLRPQPLDRIADGVLSALAPPLGVCHAAELLPLWAVDELLLAPGEPAPGSYVKEKAFRAFDTVTGKELSFIAIVLESPIWFVGEGRPSVLKPSSVPSLS